MEKSRTARETTSDTLLRLWCHQFLTYCYKSMISWYHHHPRFVVTTYSYHRNMESRILIPDSPRHSQHPLPRTARLHLLLIYFPGTGFTMSSSCPSNATLCLSNQKERPSRSLLPPKTCQTRCRTSSSPLTTSNSSMHANPSTSPQ